LVDQAHAVNSIIAAVWTRQLVCCYPKSGTDKFAEALRA
jgi:hypothetical protein